MQGFVMITDRKQLKHLNGEWKATRITYDLIKREKYKLDSMRRLCLKDYWRVTKGDAVTILVK
jgi:hypothetical protein